MKLLVRLLLFFWLMFCAVISWVGCTVLGFMLLMSNYAYVGTLTPIIGATVLFCVVKYALQILLNRKKS